MMFYFLFYQLIIHSNQASQLFMDFNRLNSRMHNKLFIVDNIAYITGGRNIGSNYFVPETSANFSDTDVLFIGAMTKYATKSFDEYWNHKLSIPASMFPKAKSKHAIKKLEQKFAEIENKSGGNSAALFSVLLNNLFAPRFFAAFGAF